MGEHSVGHLSDSELTQALLALVTRDWVGTALLLVHLAEFDARRLYLSAGYGSMFAYCVDALHLSEAAAGKRIQAARTARRFPALYPALASGRIHLTAVCRLSSHLTEENVEGLIEAATHRRTVEIETFLAGRFPGSLAQLEPISVIRPVAPREVDRRTDDEIGWTLFSAPTASSPPSESSAGDTSSNDGVTKWHKQHVLGHVNGQQPVTPGGVASFRDEPRPEPERQMFQVRVTVPKDTHDFLREAQTLLSHSIPSGDVAAVIGRALEFFVRHLRRRKAGSETVRHPLKEASKLTRHIPAHVRRAVWERDGGRCTFLASDGHRCDERRYLEFDHVQPVARGGRTEVENLRLRCRAHNQYEADLVFGSEFMAGKRRGGKAARDGRIARERRVERTDVKPDEGRTERGGGGDRRSKH